MKQYEMSQRFPESKHPNIRYFLGDIRDLERITRACSGVDIIIHAAAMKHVTASEYNPTECIATNINGARNIISAAIENNVARVIALSTDKAANPINLYGATKLCSDKLFVAANNLSGPHRTRFAIVRYGNVMGSRGSVVPFFKKLVANGESVLPITHADMTRFVITLQHGVEFVLQCASGMTGGELFVPKLPSMKVTDLVDALGEGLSYRVTGIRAGEKLHEIMIPYEESRNAIDMGDYYIIQPAHHWWNVSDFMTRIRGSGVPIEEPFEYASNTNSCWLSAAELRALAADVEPC